MVYLFLHFLFLLCLLTNNNLKREIKSAGEKVEAEAGFLFYLVTMAPVNRSHVTSSDARAQLCSNNTNDG